MTIIDYSREHNHPLYSDISRTMGATTPSVPWRSAPSAGRRCSSSTRRAVSRPEEFKEKDTRWQRVSFPKPSRCLTSTVPAASRYQRSYNIMLEIPAGSLWAWVAVGSRPGAACFVWPNRTLLLLLYLNFWLPLRRISFLISLFFCHFNIRICSRAFSRLQKTQNKTKLY